MMETLGILIDIFDSEAIKLERRTGGLKDKMRERCSNQNLAFAWTV